MSVSKVPTEPMLRKDHLCDDLCGEGIYAVCRSQWEFSEYGKRTDKGGHNEISWLRQKLSPSDLCAFLSFYLMADRFCWNAGVGGWPITQPGQRVGSHTFKYGPGTLPSMGLWDWWKCTSRGEIIGLLADLTFFHWFVYSDRCLWSIKCNSIHCASWLRLRELARENAGVGGSPITQPG